MQKSILSIAIFLLGISVQQNASSYYYYNGIFHQRICVALDDNAHNSNWTKRDNSAKFRIVAKYTRANSKPRYITQTQYFELGYNDRKLCFTISSEDDLGYSWKISGYKIDVTYGGDCEANIKSGSIDFTIRHRRGDLVNPWSCTGR